MTHKKFIKLGLFALSASVLAGCGDVTALPNADYYYQNILKNADGTSANITNNTIKQIYDALVTSGDTNSQNVLENILYIYSRTIFGSFYDRDAEGNVVLSSDSAVATRGIKWVVENGSDEDLQNFANTYSGFGGKTDRVKSFYESVVYEVNDTFYGYTTNESYQERDQFQEKKFYDAQIDAYYDLGSEYKEEFVQVYGFSRLYRDSATDAALLGKYFANIYDTYINYIELTILPDIYRNELTAAYLQNQNFGTLRMSSARRVDYISISEKSSSGDGTVNPIYSLVNSYCNSVINQTNRADNETLTNYKNTAFGFTFLESLIKGTYNTYIDQIEDETVKALAEELATEIYGNADWATYDLAELFPEPEEYNYVTKIAGENVYIESDLGDIILDYSKLYDNNRFLDDETIRTDFTNSGAYTKETGLAVKYQALLTENSTTYDWVMSGGLSGLPDASQKRAFLVQVATEIDEIETDTIGTYGANVKGNYYLLPSQYESGSTNPYIITTSSDTGSTYYLVRIDEAVKGSKITSGSSDYYGDEKAWEVAHTMAYSLSTSDSWQSAARTYYVDLMKVVFHDTSVYEYFKSTFPDIFDD